MDIINQMDSAVIICNTSFFLLDIKVMMMIKVRKEKFIYSLFNGLIFFKWIHRQYPS